MRNVADYHAQSGLESDDTAGLKLRASAMHTIKQPGRLEARRTLFNGRLLAGT